MDKTKVAYLPIFGQRNAPIGHPEVDRWRKPDTQLPVDTFDPLTVAILRRSLDQIAMALQFPHFTPAPLSKLEKQTLLTYQAYLHNPLLFATMLQNITSIEVGTPNSTTRADVVAYLYEHQDKVQHYLQETGELNPNQSRAIVNTHETCQDTFESLKAESMHFAKSVDEKNPAPLSAIQLGQSKFRQKTMAS